MLNPVNPPIVVSWRGKSYNCDLSLGALCEVEGEVNCDIVFPRDIEKSIWRKPEGFQRAVFLLALIRPYFPDTKLAECAEAVLGPKRAHYEEQIGAGLARIAPKLNELWGVKEGGADDPLPLAESSDGPATGASPEPSESANPSSGA